MTKWVVAMVIVIFATGNSFPIFFTDQSYRSLEQLDEALANGEITQEYYDEAVAHFTGMVDAESLVTGDVESRVGSETIRRPYPEWKYSSQYRQDLEANLTSIRYDNILVRGKKFRGGLGFEKRSSHSYLLRYFTSSTWGNRWRLDVGKLNTSYASGVTVGRSALHRELHSADDFGSSIVFPTQHRRNGIGFSHEYRRFTLASFASRIEGGHHYLQSAGGDFTFDKGRTGLGVVGLHQQVGVFGVRSSKFTYLAPHIQIGPPERVLATESSFQINGAAAHVLQYEFRSKKQSQSFILFSYGSSYQNLESGGYAYSDYDDATIAEVGIEYREKRAGRRGVAIEQTFHFATEKLSAQLVRWENRLDDRQCVAGRLTFEQLGRIPLLSRLRVQAVYQNLDIEHNTDTRKLITVMTRIMATGNLSYENQHKIERRVLNSSKKYPFRSRHDFTWKITDDFESIAMINYYDSDLNSPDDNQLTFAVGQEVDAGRDLRFAGRLQTRYRFATQRLDNWELRINLEVIL